MSMGAHPWGNPWNKAWPEEKPCQSLTRNALGFLEQSKNSGLDFHVFFLVEYSNLQMFSKISVNKTNQKFFRNQESP